MSEVWTHQKPALYLKYILKPWPFRVPAVDAIGEINYASSLQDLGFHTS